MNQGISKQQKLTLERLMEVASYCPDSGKFYWIKPRSGVTVGEAGTLAGNGYIYLRVDSESYTAHRLAWFYTYGEWPKGQIDHINCIRTDNRIANLRDVAPGINNQNRIKTRSDNMSSKETGVSRMRNKWRARIVLEGKTHYLGVYETIEEAKAVYLEAKRQLHQGYIDHEGI